ncbi:hypothetical protein KUCAC02_014599, partial [Chaenocephalus aceratus]
FTRDFHQVSTGLTHLLATGLELRADRKTLNSSGGGWGDPGGQKPHQNQTAWSALDRVLALYLNAV